MKNHWKTGLAIAALLCIGCMRKLRPIDFMDERSVVDQMGKKDKIIYWRNRAEAIDLRIQYEQAARFKDVNGEVTESCMERFENMFLSSAKIWNDLYHDPSPVTPDFYARIVRKHFPDGIGEPEVKEHGNYNDQFDRRLMRYYRVGDGEHEYLLHIGIEKKMYVGLDKHLNVIDYGKEGKIYLLDFVVYINNLTDEVKIADIRPLLH